MRVAKEGTATNMSNVFMKPLSQAVHKALWTDSLAAFFNGSAQFKPLARTAYIYPHLLSDLLKYTPKVC